MSSIESGAAIRIEFKNHMSKIVSNFLWRLCERIGAQTVTFIVSIILARLLEPQVYGMIALVTVFTSILQVFIDSGFGNALIQKKEADDLDFSTVFCFNIVSCSVLYILMWIASPWIARFYHLPELVSVIRVLSLTLIISGIKNIQQAYVSRNLLFKRFFFATLGGTIGAAIIGIWMAYYGYGVWALVVQHLFNATVDTLILWITVKWRPRRMFSFERLKGLFSYGWKLLVSKLLDTVYGNLRQLIIGKLYTANELAFYNRGRALPDLFVSNINSSIDSVLFPTMSAEQDDCTRVKAMTRRAIMTSTYIMAPLMMGLAACGEPIIELLLTEKWLPCVPFMRIFCITYMFYPIHTANLNAIKAMGRSDLFLKLEIIKKIVGLTLLFSTMSFGVMAIAYSLLVGGLIGQIINTWPNKKLLGYSYTEQLKDILPAIILAVGMAIAVHCLEFLKMDDGLTLFVQVTSGAVIYIGGSKVLKLESFEFVKHIMMGLIKAHR